MGEKAHVTVAELANPVSSSEGKEQNRFGGRESLGRDLGRTEFLLNEKESL